MPVDAVPPTTVGELVNYLFALVAGSGALRGLQIGKSYLDTKSGKNGKTSQAVEELEKKLESILSNILVHMDKTNEHLQQQTMTNGAVVDAIKDLNRTQIHTNEVLAELKGMRCH